MRIRLDRTMCDGFGICARHAPEHFPLDDWGYASLEGDGVITPEHHDGVLRALLDCPAHAIIAMRENQPPPVPAPASPAEEAPAATTTPPRTPGATATPTPATKETR